MYLKTKIEKEDCNYENTEISWWFNNKRLWVLINKEGYLVNGLSSYQLNLTGIQFDTNGKFIYAVVEYGGNNYRCSLNEIKMEEW